MEALLAQILAELQQTNRLIRISIAMNNWERFLDVMSVGELHRSNLIREVKSGI